MTKEQEVMLDRIAALGHTAYTVDQRDGSIEVAVYIPKRQYVMVLQPNGELSGDTRRMPPSLRELVRASTTDKPQLGDDQP